MNPAANIMRNVIPDLSLDDGSTRLLNILVEEKSV
jgi:hypothetical protein